MEALVTGMHRSGTSAVAHLLATSANASLVDDPLWVIDRGCLFYRLSDAARIELAEAQVVKCPRMTEELTMVLDDWRQTIALVLVRDPRDIWCSIKEKLATGAPTRLLDYRRLGVSATGAEAVAEAYIRYCARIESTVRRMPDRVSLVMYEQFFFDRISTVANLATCLGWPFDPTPASVLQAQQLGPRTSKAPHDQSIKGPARWKSELSDHEVLLFGRAVGRYRQLLELATTSA